MNIVQCNIVPEGGAIIPPARGPASARRPHGGRLDDTRGEGATRLHDDRTRFDSRDTGRRGLTGEPATFGASGDHEDHSIATDPEGSSVEETEEERRARLACGTERPSSY